MVFVALAVYAPTVRYELVWDDRGLVRYISETIRLHGLGGLLRADYRLDAGNAPSLGYYRPVVLMSLWIDGLATRVLPFAYHLTNVFLHASNSALVFLLARTCFPGSREGALLGALIFALHPVHVEAVAFVGARADLWTTGFALLASLLWLRDRRGLAKLPRLEKLASLLSLLLACLSKEAAFLLPAVLVLWAWIEKGPDARLVPGKAHSGWLFGWAAAIAAALLLRLASDIGFGLSASETSSFLPRDRLLPLQALLIYLRLLVLPWPLNAYYGESQVGWNALAAVCAAALAAVCAALGLRGKGRLGLLAAVWILVFLVPVLGVVPIAGAPIAERFLYLPSVGLALLIAPFGGLQALGRRSWMGVAAILLAVMAAATLARARVWRNELALFSDMVATSPEAAVGWDNLGRVFYTQGRIAEAANAHQRAVALEPRYAAAQERLAVELSQLGRNEEAVSAFRRAIELDSRPAGSWSNLGVLYAWMGRHGEAAEAYRQAIRFQPGSARTFVNLGISLVALGREKEAHAALTEGLRLDPELTEAHFYLGVALLRLGRIADAEEQRRLLRSSRPDLAERLEELMRGPTPP